MENKSCFLRGSSSDAAKVNLDRSFFLQYITTSHDLER